MSKPGRNELCHCGSGKTFKRCHGITSESSRLGRVLMIVVGLGVAAAVVAGVTGFTTDRPSSVRVWDPGHGHFHDANGQEVP